MLERYKILDTDEINQALSELSGWELEKDGLKHEFKFHNFIEAFAFLTKVAICAEKFNHHPEIFNSYNKVIIKGLCTHYAGSKITTLDIDLAKEISKL